MIIITNKNRILYTCCTQVQKKFLSISPSKTLLNFNLKVDSDDDSDGEKSFDRYKNDDQRHFIEHYSKKHTSSITMRELIEFGLDPKPRTLLFNAQFLHEELPIRLSQRVVQLENLPLGLSRIPAIRSVRNLYADSFRRVRMFPKPKTTQQELAFTQLLSEIKIRHKETSVYVAEGLQDLCNQSEEARNYDFSNQLNKFYSSRIGIRLLIGQHVALHTPREGFVGVIEKNLNVIEACKLAYNSAAELCRKDYGHVPELKFLGKLDATITYVPNHFYYVLLELFKNSLRATIERHQKHGNIPYVEVVIAEGKADVCVKISDRGGGIPRESVKKIWTYSFSTQTKLSPQSKVVAGVGHGLPYSRLYSRYFGGNVEVISMDGYGTDAYAYFNKIGDVIIDERVQ
eukprot:c7819_g2_i1.p1 GENE.c7819_g2_i1~~c7819_g2_i1.p1  ORF type:complete len:401 (+),score=118.45 c7819_g2_i1:45-1247(+)